LSAAIIGEAVMALALTKVDFQILADQRVREVKLPAEEQTAFTRLWADVATFTSTPILASAAAVNSFSAAHLVVLLALRVLSVI